MAAFAPFRAPAGQSALHQAAGDGMPARPLPPPDMGGSPLDPDRVALSVLVFNIQGHDGNRSTGGSQSIHSNSTQSPARQVYCCESTCDRVWRKSCQSVRNGLASVARGIAECDVKVCYRSTPHTLDHSEINALEAWWAVTGSNRRHPACKAGALPAELTALSPDTLCTGD